MINPVRSNRLRTVQLRTLPSDHRGRTREWHV